MITDKHKAFARAVVALARAHKMDRLQLDFDMNFSSRSDEGFVGGREIVTMEWSEGRHGIASNISLKTRATEAITEKAPEPTETGGNE